MKKFYGRDLVAEETALAMRGKHYFIEYGDWGYGGFYGDIFVDHAATEEEAIRIGLSHYTKGRKEAVRVWSPSGDLVFERRDDIDIEQEFIDGFIDALKSLAPSYDAEEDMTYSDNPHPTYHLMGASNLDLATERSAYEAGRAKAKEVAEDIERMCAEEKAMKAEEEEDCGF